jgi:hypothetical protein
VKHAHHYIDFHAVEPKHADVHVRLENWARWSRGRGSGGNSSPMFRLYRPPQHWRNTAESVGHVNALDAAEIQKAMPALPMKHRLALAWCYIVRNNPAKAAAQMGESLPGLALLIRDGRQMLINHGYG